jgi:hypothetical protein
MSPPTKARRFVAVSLAAALVGTGAAASVDAHGRHPGKGGSGPAFEGLRLEQLDRGLVAATTDEGVFLSWRLLGNEVSGYNDSGMTGTDFNVYRDGELIAAVDDSTNYLDAGADGTAEYSVAAVVGGVEVDYSDSVSPWDDHYLDIPLQKPADGVTPMGEAYEYRANDVSVGDLTGDGRYEYVVKWDPSNSKDVSQRGYTGPVYIDAYTLEGDLMWRIDLGVNIRAGAHYTQFNVYDHDGDGIAEVMFKTAPGTKWTTYKDGAPESEGYVSLPAGDVADGVTHDDDYRFSAADYFDYVVEAIFMKWHEYEDVVAGNWPATIESALGAADRFDFDYPLSREDAETLGNFFFDVYAPGRSGNNRLREFNGFVITGPEYLTVFDGTTGAELDTIDFPVLRGDDGLLWGDYAMSRIEPGNRVDRFLSGVAYLDGENPSSIFARGYYTRTTITAIDWDGEKLTERWKADSGHAPLTNPFNDGPHGREGPDPEWGTLTTQGFHSLSLADVDGDGTQEIIYGGATLNADGSLRYSSYDWGHPSSSVPGQWVKLGHGDAEHVGNFDPNRPGLEIWTCHEGGPWAPYGWVMRDADTGEILWGDYSGRDTGRAMVGDIDPDIPGFEVWASMPPNEEGRSGLYTVTGEPIDAPMPGTNMSIRWAADMTTQWISGHQTEQTTPTRIHDFRNGVLLEDAGTLTNNWTKGNPGLVADVFGDWREELLTRTADSSALRIYLSTELTDRKLYTLMHDPQYRVGVATQQSTYNQPQYTSFYMASDMDWSQVPLPDYWTPGSLDALKSALDGYYKSGDVDWARYIVLKGSLSSAEHFIAKGQNKQAIKSLKAFNTTLEKSKKGVSAEAKAVLTHKARQLIAQLD